MKKRILLTGASGFVGKRYMSYNSEKYDISPFSIVTKMPSIETLSSVDTVIHLGGLAHQMQKTAPEKYFEANFERTRQLALITKKAGVKHFIFISTIKVFGENQNQILTLNSPCLPENDPYGESKLKAEQYLDTLNDEKFTVSVIRPPLIYGPGVKGNLDKLLKLCDTNYPLPFRSINNRRTMIYLDNFIELINRLVDTGTGGTFLAGDNSPITTEELVTMIRKYMGRPLKLFTIPYFLQYILKLVRPELATRLFGSLEMDSATSYKKINFAPPYPIEEGIKVMVDFYLTNSKHN